jgi:hypothetical protein
MSHPDEYRRGSSFGLRSLTLAMLAIFTIQTGCSSAPTQTPLQKAREEVSSRILSREVEPARTVDGQLERFGRLTLAIADEAPHTVSFVLRQTLVRGAEDAVLEVHDEKTGERTVYVLNDETGDAWVYGDNTRVHMVFNPDETVQVGDKVAANAEEAAKILLETGEMDGVSDYALFTMIDVISEYLPKDGTGKGGAVVVLVAVGVWIAGSTYGCSRQYRQRGCNIYALSNYCRSWCASYLCFC